MIVTFSASRISGWYFIVQGCAILAWWIALASSPGARAWFIPPGASELELLAFRLPDLLVAAPASFAGGVAILTGRRWAVPLAWVVAGAVDYAFVYCVAWSMLRDGGWLGVALMAPAALLSTVSALDVSASSLAIFRRAAPAPARRHVLATLAQIAVFWSFFLFVVPVAILYVERRLPLGAFGFPGHAILAVVLFLLFSVLGLASGVTMAARGRGTPLPFATTNRLVTAGPYGYLRNPMVVAGLGQGAAVGIWLGSPLVLAYVVLGGLLWEFFVRPAEERDLAETFGTEFTHYRQNVGCWVPRRRAYVPGSWLHRASSTTDGPSPR